MRPLFFVLCTLMFAFLGADEPAAPPAENVVPVTDAAPQYKASSLVNMTAMPSTIVNGSVNVITGDYCEMAEDAHISGPDPFVLGHAYFSSSLEEGTLGNGWNFYHHHLLQVYQPDSRHLAYLCEPFGGKITFQSDYDNKTKKRSPFLLKTKNTGFTNVSGDTIGAQNNVRNSSVEWHKKGDYWTAIFPDGTGRTYKRQLKRSSPIRNYQLSTERKPSGNICLYEYNDKFEIAKIQTFDKKRTKLHNWVTFNQKSVSEFSRHPSLHVSSSDGEEYVYYFNLLKGRKKDGIYAVSGIYRPGFPYTRFQYSKKSTNHKKRVLCRSTDDGCYLDTRYYGKVNNYIGEKKVGFKSDKHEAFCRNRVRYQAAPAGANNEKIITHAYYYYRDGKEGGHTKVLDAYNQPTRYYWNKQKRLVKVKRADNSFETFVWGKGKNQGHLMVRSQFDETGIPRLTKEFHYDAAGNVIEEFLYGRCTTDSGEIVLDQDGYVTSSTCDKIKTSYTYTNDKFHLKTSECDSAGNYTYFKYVEGTNLLQARLVCDKQKIKKREFFAYDDNALCVEHIIDDGSCHEKEKLEGVTERHITRHSYRCVPPHFEAPVEIGEYYYDFAAKKERLVGRTLHSYSEKGFVIKKELFDANNQSVGIYLYDYDAIGRVVYSKNPLGIEERFTYDLSGRLSEKVGPRHDVKHQYEYDLMGRLIKETEIQEGGPTLVSRYVYDKLGRKTAIINPQGHTTYYEYDVLDRLTKVISGTAVKSYQYSNLGSTVTETDERGYETAKIYNIFGKVFYEQLPDGFQKHYCYDKKGNCVKEIDATGLVQKSVYDALNRITSVVLKKDKRILSEKKMSYNSFHLMTEEQPTGEKIQYSYDAAGRKRKMQVQTKKTTYHYDTLSRLCEERLYTGTTEYITNQISYDILHRKVKETATDHKGITHSYKLFRYDVEGNCTEVHQNIGGKASATISTFYPHGLPKSVTDAEGNTTTYFYDFFFLNSSNELVLKNAVIDPMGVKTEEEFDPRGNLVLLTRFDPFGKLIAKQQLYYDEAKNLVRQDSFVLVDGVLQNTITICKEYGPNNREESIVEAKNSAEEKITEYRYNKFGQKVQTLYSDGNAVHTRYDEKGRVAVAYAEDNSFSYDYFYDAQDRIVKVHNNLTKKATLRQYDAIGNLTSETLENKLKIGYGYDRASRINQLMLPDGSGISYHYSPAQLEKIERFDAKNKKLYQHEVVERDLSGKVLASKLALKGGKLTFEYDNCGRVIEIDHKQFQQKIPIRGYDEVGNLRKIKTTDPNGAVESRFRYDYLYQVTSEKGNATHQYSYDSLFNRIQMDEARYKVNSLHSVLSDGNNTFSYDKRGNRLTARHSDNKITYRYDTFDRLVEVIKKGQSRIVYGYDAFHRRMEKTVYSHAALGWKKKSHERYLYVGTNEIGAVDDKGTIFQLRVLGDGMGAEIGSSVAIELNSSVYIPLHDYRGNVVSLLDGKTGAAVESYRYDAFGVEQISTEASVGNPWRFSSKRVDEETGFVFFGRRYYDPSLGKWLTQDPLGLKEGPNLYAYVHNSPLTHRDLYGLLDEQGGEQRSTFGRVIDRCVSGVSYAIDRIRDIGCKVAEEIVHNIPHIGDWNNRAEDQLRSWRGAAQKVRPPSGVYLVAPGQPTASGIGAVLSYNGLICQDKDALKNTLIIQNEFEGNHPDVYQVYSASDGFCMDFGRAVLNVLGIPTANVTAIAEGLKPIMENCKSQNTNVMAFGHSNGGLTHHLVEKQLPREYKSMFKVCSLGSSYIFQDGHNYFGGSDFVPIIADPIGYLACLATGWCEESNFTFTGHPFKIPFSNHSLRSEEYRNAIRKFIKKYK